MAETSSPASAQVPPASAVLHDPLPESTWGWRRLYIWAILTVSVVGIALMVQSIRDLASSNPDLAVVALKRIIGWVLILDWCTTTYYLIAPTGEQVTRWVQTASMLKNGVSIGASALVRGSDGSTAQTSTVAGPTGTTQAALPQPEVDAAPTART
jgi:hypothetical protein